MEPKTKRYIRIDIEYEPAFPDHSWDVINNIKRLFKEDMPYIKLLNARDTPNKVELDDNFYKLAFGSME